MSEDKWMGEVGGGSREKEGKREGKLWLVCKTTGKYLIKNV